MWWPTRGLLVPPLAMKFDLEPPLRRLIDQAAFCFGESNLIVVVGFSFADADQYISQMLSNAMQQSDDTRLIIFDPNPEIASKVRRRFEVQIPNFDPKRILEVSDDCSQTCLSSLKVDFLSLKGSLKRKGRHQQVKKRDRAKTASRIGLSIVSSTGGWAANALGSFSH